MIFCEEQNLPKVRHKIQNFEFIPSVYVIVSTLFLVTLLGEKLAIAHHVPRTLFRTLWCTVSHANFLSQSSKWYLVCATTITYYKHWRSGYKKNVYVTLLENRTQDFVTRKNTSTRPRRQSLSIWMKVQHPSHLGTKIQWCT